MKKKRNSVNKTSALEESFLIAFDSLDELKAQLEKNFPSLPPIFFSNIFSEIFSTLSQLKSKTEVPFFLQNKKTVKRKIK